MLFMFCFFFCSQSDFIAPDAQACHAVSSRCIPFSILEALFVIIHQNLDFATQEEYDNEVADDTRTIEEVKGRPQGLCCADSSDDGPGTTDGIVNLNPDAFQPQ